MKKSTQKWNKMFLAGMAAMVLAFGLVAIGCGEEDDPAPYGNGTITLDDGTTTYRANLSLTFDDDEARTSGDWEMTVKADEDMELEGRFTVDRSGTTVIYFTGDASGYGTYDNPTVTGAFIADGETVAGVFNVGRLF